MSTVIDERRQPRFGMRHRLVLAREVAELSQTDMAGILGCARPTVSNYERGFTEPRRSVLLAWAMATGVDSDWLMTGTSNPDDVPPTGVEPATYGTNVRRFAAVTPIFGERAA